jgi:hypothetical protein
VSPHYSPKIIISAYTKAQDLSWLVLYYFYKLLLKIDRSIFRKLDKEKLTDKGLNDAQLNGL